MRRRPILTIVLLLLGLLAVVGAVAAIAWVGAVEDGRVAGSDVGMATEAGGPAAGAPGETASGQAADDSDVSGAVPAAGSAAPHSLVRSGDLVLLIARSTLPATMSRIATMTAEMDGYLMSSSMGGGTAAYDRPAASDAEQTRAPTTGATPTQAWLTLRVPQARFDSALTQFSALGEVQRVSTSSEDVSEQYVDLRARLRHHRAIERRLLRFLAATGTIREMLLVQDRLDTVQLTMEQLEAQLTSLSERATYATLTLSLQEKDVPEAGEIDQSDTFAGVLTTSLRLLTRGARLLALGLTAALPWLAVAAAVGLAVWYALRWWRRRRVPPPVV